MVKYKLKEIEVGDVQVRGGSQSTVTAIDPITGAISWDITTVPEMDTTFKKFAQLRDFYNTKITEIKSELNKFSKKTTEKVIQIKLNEVTKLLSPLGKTSNVGNDDLVNLLQYYALLEELVTANG